VDFSKDKKTIYVGVRDFKEKHDSISVFISIKYKDQHLVERV